VACTRDRAVSPAQITEQLAAIAPATIRGRTRIPAPAATTSSSSSRARSTRPGHSATSPTPSTCATYGCTASTRPAPPARQSTSPGLSAEVSPGCGLTSDGLRRRANAPRASVRTELGPAPARHRWRATGSPWRAFWTWAVAGY